MTKHSQKRLGERKSKITLLYQQLTLHWLDKIILIVIQFNCLVLIFSCKHSFDNLTSEIRTHKKEISDNV